MGQRRGVRRPFPKASEVLERHRVECAGPDKWGKQPPLPKKKLLGSGKTRPQTACKMGEVCFSRITLELCRNSPPRTSHDEN